jgi:hypothetical protein
VRPTLLALLLCAACGHVSNGAGTAVTVATAAALVQLLAPPALEGQTGICPQYREIRCVASVFCMYDELQGCDVCRCSAILRGSAIIAPAAAATSGSVRFEQELFPAPWAH